MADHRDDHRPLARGRRSAALIVAFVACGHPAPPPAPAPSNVTAPTAAPTPDPAPGWRIVGAQIRGSYVIVTVAQGANAWVAKDMMGRMVTVDGRDLGFVRVIRIDRTTSQWTVLKPLADGPAGARVIPIRGD